MNRRRRKKKKKSSDGSSAWLTTYTDMIQLILVFFILLFAMSQIDVEKFQAISQSFRERAIFDFFPSPVPMEHPSESPSFNDGQNDIDEFLFPPRPEEAEEIEEDEMEQLVTEIENFLDEENLHGAVTANRTGRGIVLVLQDRILFDPGEAEILPSGEPFLQKIGKLFVDIPNNIKVEGHTDSVPMSSYRYPSNWELSGARASSVIRYLLDHYPIAQERFSLAGFGETRPVAPNDTSENRQKNRRVEIIILNETSEENDNQDD